MASKLNCYGFPDGSQISTNGIDPEIKKLVDDSAKARDLAYCPYSKFNVGAALLAENGKVYTGCNIECSSYGGTVCAERTAAAKAISEGVRKFKAIAVIASTVRDFTAPCGICRQFLMEFGDICVFIVKSDLSSVKIVGRQNSSYRRREKIGQSISRIVNAFVLYMWTDIYKANSSLLLPPCFGKLNTP